jgi:hypothetical protein
MPVTLNLELLPDAYAIVRLDPGSTLPDWIAGKGVVTVTFAEDEVSIVCPSARVPSGLESSDGWSAIKLSATFEFDEAGVVLSVVRPISEAGLGIFVTSTFHRDYILVRTNELARARDLLTRAGHTFV